MAGYCGYSKSNNAVQAELVAEGSFSEIIDILFDEYPSDNAPTLSIRIQGPYADDFIIRDATSSAALDALNILQLITFYQL